MEHYKGILVPEKKRNFWKIALWCAAGVAIFAGVGFLAFTAHGKSLVTRGSAIVMESFGDVFGMGDSGGSVREIGFADADGFSLGSSSSAGAETSDVSSKTSKKKTTALKTTSKKSAVPSKPVSLPIIVEANPPPSISATSDSNTAGTILPSSTSATSSSVSKIPIATKPPPVSYMVAIALAGDGRGMVTSSLPGINCGTTCAWGFASGTILKLHATADTVSSFGGWTGACSGNSKDCTLVVRGYMSVGVTFRSSAEAIGDSQESNEGATAANNQQASGTSTEANTGATGGESNGASSSSTADGSSSATSSSSSPIASDPLVPNHLLIVAVQIAGDSSGDDFVKIANPTANDIDVSSWKLHKKSSTGTDYSLKAFPKGTIISAGATLTWADSANGFDATIGADFSSEETLAVDNSVALLDASSSIVDAVAWGDGVNPYVEGDPFPTDPTANQVLTRITQGGAYLDTDDNAQDFQLEGG